MELFLAAFAATVATELVVLALLAPAGERARLVKAALALNAITHPLAFTFAHELGWAITEALVFAVEAGLLALIGIAARRALAWSLVANAVSAACALVYLL